MFKVFDKLIHISAFPKVSSVNHELKKVALLRIILGIIIFVRFAEISHSMIILNFKTSLIIISFLFLIVIICFIVGLFTQVASFLLLFSSRLADSFFGTSTLGTAILEITILPLFLVNSGQYYSFDRLILKKGKGLSRLLTPIYCLIRAREKQDFNRAYFLAFVIYAIISFGALLLHLQDTYWINGLTTKSLLLNSYLNKHYEWFRLIDLKIPYLLSVLSILAGIFQSVFQLLMIPLIFFNLGRKFIFFWGMNFFLISLFFINLSYLPHIEIILWLLILSPIYIVKTKTISILYDDHCNLCKRAMRFFKTMNFNGNLVFLPLSKNRELYAAYDLTDKEVKTYMVGFKEGKIYKGYNLYYKISQVNSLFWIFIPLLYLGKISRIGTLIYNYIAERRYHIFGQCELSFKDEIAEKDLHITNKSNKFLTSSIFGMYFLLIFIYTQYKVPYVKSIIPKPKPLDYIVRKALSYSGFDLPNVFNKKDLSMGDNWLEVYQCNENGEEILTPITGKYGERHNYINFDILNFTNHGSDVLYFGATLRFSRGVINNNVVQYLKNDKGLSILKRRIQYDYSINNFKGTKQYLVKACGNQSSKVTHGKSNPDRYIKEIKFKSFYTYDGQMLIKK